jgi:hypothetical protein
MLGASPIPGGLLLLEVIETFRAESWCGRSAASLAIIPVD